VQDPAPFLSLHTALAPQGDGLHGLTGRSVTGGAKKSHSMLDLSNSSSVLEEDEEKVLRGGVGEHPVNGSPVYPEIQRQIGECLTTVQVVLDPQDPGQGSLHFSFWHARFPGHSALMVHSGLQLGARPM
jgi:hypothetical protein